MGNWKGLHVFGPFLSPKGETFCTHLAIRQVLQDRDYESAINLADLSTNVHGTEVGDAWGYVMNYLDWGEMKKRSRIHERFANVGMDFVLNRRERDMDMTMAGPQGEPTEHYPLLAESEKGKLLDDTNSIVIETESLHGVWENRVGIPTTGWNPDWWWPAVASVIAIAVLVGLLTAIVLVKTQVHRDLVKNLLPDQAIRKLQRDQTVIERFHMVTVFYADVVGDSNANASSKQVMSMLNDLYYELDRLAKKHGVYKVEAVGSRYMVVGGAPEREAATRSAKRVALFALEALDFVQRKFVTKEGDRVTMRAGICSGPAMGGVLGKSMPRYCFFGETVDLASNLERTSKEMKVQCSEATFSLLRDVDNEVRHDKARRYCDNRGQSASHLLRQSVRAVREVLWPEERKFHPRAMWPRPMFIL